MNFPINQGFSQLQAWKYQLALYAQQNPVAANALAPLISPHFGADALLRGGFGQGGFQTPGFGHSPCGCVPQPNIQFSGAPAGRGLQTNPEGWPQGAVKTAGGYTIVPEGKDAAWSVYAPGQKPGETPQTRIWGDPHVSEKDGTRWDFTKNSNFRLPDGTNISVGTTSQTGQSVSATLDITNGNDRVQVSGINNNRPVTGQVTQDGFLARSQISNSTDTFHLGGAGGSDVKWFLERDGKMQGEVTGAHYDRTTNRYEQKVNADSRYAVDPSMRPPFGSDAWGNQLRMEAVDIARRSGNPEYARQMSMLMEADHVHGLIQGAYGFDPLMALGGYGQFGGFQQQQLSVGNLFQFLQYQEAINQWSAQARTGTVWG